MPEEKFSLTNKTKSVLPRAPWLKIKNTAVGKNYSLSLVFVDEKKSKLLNKSYRGKNKPTNVLSFSLDKNNGEIFITPSLVRKQVKSFGREFSNLIVFLFIHSLCHLKGYSHGSTMERAEERLRKKFGV